MKSSHKTGIWILALLLVVALFMSTLMFSPENTTKELSYSALVAKVQADEIASVSISGNVARAVPKKIAPAEPAEGKAPSMVARPALAPSLVYKTQLPERGGESLLMPDLQAHQVPVRFEEPQSQGQWMQLLTIVFLPLLAIVFFVVIFRNIQSGGSQAMSFGKSKAKMQMDSKVKITFNDVAGIDEAKTELEEVVDFLKNPERYQKLGAKVPKGVLLVGSPGTGKTLLAKAVAGEAGVPFFTISGSDFVEMFVGVGASRVRDLFEQAKKHAPCIVFVDEIDAVGRQRGAGMGGGHDEREQTLNQLLVEMDGFDGTTGIIIIAATNRPDILDNALLRPGRFDRQVVIDRPDMKGREQILNVHAKGKPLADDVDLKRLAKSTPGFTGADLANLLNEGALYAARHLKESISQNDIEQAIEKVIAGVEKKSRLISEKDKELTAYHEVGHALVGMLVEGCDPLRKVSIIPRGMALGLTWTMPDDNKVHTSRKQLIARIAMTLGGRAAEKLIYNDCYTGASDDLNKVTELARKIVTQFGMSDELGPMVFGKANEHVFMGRDFGHERNYGEDVASVIDREIKRIVAEQYALAIKILSDNRDVMDAVVNELLEKETLDDDEVKAIYDRVVARRTDGSINVPRQMLPETPVEELPALLIAPSDTDESNVVLVPPNADVPVSS
ncbi:MAG: ATP-dependent zinc metalloprotease FtsH [Vampirovibrionales bacterium]|nr:ATP-dependent zinc metalloprotease FtsH [Vampirovibrionales bacterium]